MSQTIWKFPLTARDGMYFVPGGATILHVNTQGNDTCLWVQVDPLSPMVCRKFVVIGTGWDVPARSEYIGTAHRDGYVWHVYEVM